MLTIELLRSTLKQSTNPKLIKLIFWPLTLYWGAQNFVINNSSNIQKSLSITKDTFPYYCLLLLAAILIGFIYYSVFRTVIKALNSIKNSTKFKAPRIRIVRSYKLFLVDLLATFYQFLGFLCFLLPGFVLLKRYQYALLIAEEESLSPVQSLKKSKELSMNNGWQVLSGSLVIWLIQIILTETWKASSGNPFGILLSLFLFLYAGIFHTCFLYMAKDKLRPKTESAT